MSLPAADLPAPIAVLVLAWDEATPAVRALVEAARAPALPVESILVMVPQADAPDHLSAEEYLPLPADTYPAAPLAADELPQDAQEAAEPSATPLALREPQEIAATDADLTEPSAGPDPSPALAALPKEVTAPPAWAAVRVLRLASHSLPQLAHRAGRLLPAPVWPDLVQTPAAPYFGATPLAIAPPAASPVQELVAASAETAAHRKESAHAIDADPAPVQPAPAPIPAPVTTPDSEAAASASAPAPVYEPAEALPQGTLETDLPLAETEINELEEAPSRDLFQEAEFSPSPAQAGWPEALAALRQPAPLAAPAVAGPPPGPLPAPKELVLTPTPELASPAPGALQPAATHYPAPDLNYQVIQYARFAVPVALAETDFAVLYAPAWPTWLAAQELRQRTGRPLVLHVAALAAGTEPAGTATGWMAELQRQALLRADLVLAETPALAERLRHELGLPFSRVLTIAAADAGAIAQALHTARPRPVG
jgi:hypothetical protein